MQEISAIFKNSEDAERAIGALEEAGFSNDKFSLIAGESITDVEEVKEGASTDTARDKQDVMVTVRAEGAQVSIAKTIFKQAKAIQVNDQSESELAEGPVGPTIVPPPKHPHI
jgi:ribose 5-phosphate isomerase RpiB